MSIASIRVTWPSGSLFAQDTAGRPAYVIGAWGHYAAINKNTLQVVGGGDLFSERSASAANNSVLKEVAGLDVMRATPDLARKRVFLLLAIPQSAEFAGFAVVELEPPKVVRVLKLDVALQNAEIIISPAGDRIYATYWHWESPQPPNGALLSRTVVYDGQSYQAIRTFPGRPFGIQPSSCFLGDGELYTSRRVFDPLTGKELSRTKFFGKEGIREVGCRNGRLLLLTRDADKNTTLIVYDLRSDVELNTIRTDIPARGWPVEGERLRDWTFSDDGNLIIHTELPTRERPLIIRTFDAATRATAKVQLQLPFNEGRFVGTSSDGGRLFYGSETKLFVVNLKTGQASSPVILPMRPGVMIWDGR